MILDGHVRVFQGVAGENADHTLRLRNCAIRQHLPLHTEDLPAKARVAFTLYVTAIRDEDNADWARKWIADTLKQKQSGAMKWRQGAYDEKGYFLDDAPRYCTMEPVEQVLCKRGEERVEVTIEALAQENVA